MPIFAIVNQSGLILNRVVADPNYQSDDEELTAIEETSDAYDIGGVISDGVYSPPQADETGIILQRPQAISDRQFFQQLAVDGIISEEQALASNAAVIPAPLLVIIEQLPKHQQFDAKMKVSGATTFLRNDPLTIGIGTAYGMSSEQIDSFFTAASAL